jgi:hypothetical protein
VRSLFIFLGGRLPPIYATSLGLYGELTLKEGRGTHRFYVREKTPTFHFAKIARLLRLLILRVINISRRAATAHLCNYRSK